MAEQVVSMIEEMRENGESMRLWKNVELSVKCIERLNAIDDASETCLQHNTGSYSQI